MCHQWFGGWGNICHFILHHTLICTYRTISLVKSKVVLAFSCLTDRGSTKLYPINDQAKYTQASPIVSQCLDFDVSMCRLVVPLSIRGKTKVKFHTSLFAYKQYYYIAPYNLSPWTSFVWWSRDIVFVTIKQRHRPCLTKEMQTFTMI